MKMELKVSVDGVPRVVCGVTDKTTCQEVVIALAQALGRTGRYTLREKFKEFERNVTPDERLLESLAKYGQHSREVHLTLLRNGPSLGGGAGDGDARRRGSQQAWAPLRRGDAGGRGRRGSGGGGSFASRRQSLPPLSRLCLRAQEAAAAQEAEQKKPKRKSLTLVEEAFGWLENLGRSGKAHRGREKERGKDPEKRKGWTSDGSPAPSRDCWSPSGVCGMGCQQRTAVTVRQQRRSFLEDLGSGREHDRDSNDNCSETVHKDAEVRRDQELNAGKAKADRKPELQTARKAGVSPTPPPHTVRMEEEKLLELLIQQRARLRELQLELDSADAQIRELEERQRAQPHQEATGELADEEPEEGELAYWENELRAEEGYERDLQEQFLEMKQKAVECKAKLEEYKCRLQGLDLTGGRRTLPEAELPVEPGRESPSVAQRPAVLSWTKPQAHTVCSAARQDVDLQQARPLTPNREVVEKRPAPTAASHRPHVLVSPHQTEDRRVGRAGQPQGRGACQSEAQNQPGTRQTSSVLHRSEITIHLSSTRV